ncbi:MAG: hypothetical protein IH885_10025 [Myxococcales bacterium]|nr:hypothetical protein [Myxococcales bacterium]
MKPFIAVLWVLSIALAVGLTRLAGPDPGGSAPSFSLDEAFGETDPLRRAYLISHALHDFGPDDVAEMKRVFVSRRVGFEMEEVQLAMLAWARFDGPGAYAWASEWPSGWKRTLTAQSLWAWGFHDGAAAIRFVEEIEEPELKERLKQNALGGWMRSSDKDGVSEYIANFATMGPRGRLTFLLAGEVLMERGIDGAMRWVDNLPEDSPNDLKRVAFDHVAKSVAAEEPIRAAEWFLAHRTEAYSAGALRGIARRWVQNHDPRSAFEWLMEMSIDGDGAGQRDEAISAGFRSWIQSDADAAQAWLLPMVPNEALDAAVLEATKRLTPKEPSAAMDWARRLDDESKRNRELIRVASRWKFRDSDSLGEWLNESDISEETRQIILNGVPRSGQRIKINVNSNPKAARKP